MPHHNEAPTVKSVPSKYFFFISYKTRKSFEECYIRIREELILTNSSMIANGHGRVGEWLKPYGC